MTTIMTAAADSRPARRRRRSRTASLALVAATSLVWALVVPLSLPAAAATNLRVVAWGRNAQGQANVPTGLAGVIAVSAGTDHSLALKSDGTVSAWGDNGFGQTTVPAGLTGVTAMDAGFLHNLALKADGTVVAWGNNGNGQATVPTGLTDVVGVSGGQAHSLALRADGTVVAWGASGNGQVTVPAGLFGVFAVSAGGFHSLALKADGTVVAWGDNTFGQTNVPAGLTDVVSIAAGGWHSVALKADGTVVAWGRNDAGQGTAPAGLNGVTAVSTAFIHNLALKADGTVVAWGDNSDGQSTVPAELTGVAAIAAGGHHSLALVPNTPQPVATIETTATTPVALGSSISDTATVTGAPAAPAPTGTVTFTLFGPANPTCTGAPVFTSPGRPLAGGPPPTAGSGNFTPSAPGSYNWVAVYSGDTNYTSATSSCGAPNETSVVNQAAATIATSATTPVALGSSISDTATVTGAPAAPAPTGTVTFTLFGPGNPTCTGAPVFTSPGRPLAGGPPPTATSGNFTPTAPGSYNWVAVYSGDTNYTSVISPCGAPDETSTVGRATPTISTQASAGGPIGTSVTDTATISGGSSPTGTVTFRLFSDAICASEVFTSTNALTAGTATSGSYSPATVGVYRWTAVYSGDANNNLATSGCDAPNESATITKASPTISTQASGGGILGVPVTDTATVTGGFSPTGTVTFRLFSDITCATQVFMSTNALAGGTVTSGSFTPGAPGTYFWTAVYGGDANNNAAASACNAPDESVVITPFQAPPYTRTITGDVVGPITVRAEESVLITNGRVVGPVTVEPGGALTIENSRITRGIVAIAPSFFSICGTDVSDPSPATALSVTNAPVPVRAGDPATGCAGNRFAGQVMLSSNLAVTFGANAVSHNATVNNNGPGNTVVKANNVFATLGCAGNNPPPTNAGQPNTAGAKTGQCAGL